MMDVCTQRLYDCGCAIKKHTSWQMARKAGWNRLTPEAHNGYAIDYCPQHAAADAMYEALARLLPPVIDMWREGVIPEPDIFAMVLQPAQAALALADGD